MNVKLDFGGDRAINNTCPTKEIEYEMDGVNESIVNKVEATIIDIPCVPTKEMSIDLLTFGGTSQFNFTELENKWIDEECNRYFSIVQIYITPFYLSIVISPD